MMASTAGGAPALRGRYAPVPDAETDGAASHSVPDAETDEQGDRLHAVVKAAHGKEKLRKSLARWRGWVLPRVLFWCPICEKRDFNPQNELCTGTVLAS